MVVPQHQKVKIMQLFAQPYDISAQGFYFDSFEEYAEKAEANLNSSGQPVEEYEIQAIDEEASDFAKIVPPNQCNLEQWIEWADKYAGLDSREQYAFQFLCDATLWQDVFCDEVFDKVDEVCIFEGTPGEYAEEFVSDCYNIEKMMGNLACYFDYEAFGRDLVLGGDIVEIALDVYVTNPHDF